MAKEGELPKIPQHIATGRLGEELAAEFLARKGFRIIERNYLRPWGEIDIIAEKGGIVRFVEVKSVTCDTLQDVSRENNWYRPEEMVHPAKLKKVARTAELYMQNRHDDEDFQIDVVGVFIDKENRTARCRIYERVY